MDNSTKKTTPAKSEEQKENENIHAAEVAAEKDIEQDPELSLEPEPGDDLDEGELARFEDGE